MRERVHPLNRLRRHALSRAALKAVDIPIWVKLPGVRWKAKVRMVRHASSFVLSGGMEPEILVLFHEISRQFGIRSFWDVGANVGYYSWVVKSVAPEARVRVFEPDTDNLTLLRETIRRAHLRDIVVREVAVSDVRGARLFAHDNVSGSTGAIQESGVTYSERYWGVPPSFVEVDTVSLDDERASAGAVDLIKIDVEGHEEAVIRGALDTIRRDQPIVIFECFHGGQDICGALKPMGYSFVDAERMGNDLGAATNFLALPKRYESKLEELRRRCEGGAAGG
jgi:FkbM family methyltransferase